MTDHDLLLEIVERLARVEALLDPDTARLNVLVPRIAAIVADASFEVGDLEDEVSFDGLSVAQVGLLLKRNVGRVFGGFRIDVLDKSRSVREWTLTPIADVPEQAAQSLPSNHKGARR